MDVLNFFPNMDTWFKTNIIPEIGVGILSKPTFFNFWTHPLYKATLYTNEIQYPTLLPNFRNFWKPTVSKAWVTNYVATCSLFGGNHGQNMEGEKPYKVTKLDR